jgi:hypothetical protein
VTIASPDVSARSPRAPASEMVSTATRTAASIPDPSFPSPAYKCEPFL